jgi:hypothetical protein
VTWWLGEEGGTNLRSDFSIPNSLSISMAGPDHGNGLGVGAEGCACVTFGVAPSRFFYVIGDHFPGRLAGLILLSLER